MEPAPLKICARISGVGKYLPERILSNAEIAKLVDTSDEWIRDRTGIRERRVAADDETASTLGIEAGRQALEQAEIDPEDLDLVIASTTTPDGMFPSVASLVQHGLGARRSGAFDINAACVGFAHRRLAGSQHLCPVRRWRRSGGPGSVGPRRPCLIYPSQRRERRLLPMGAGAVRSSRTG